MNKLIAFGDSFTWGSELTDSLDNTFSDPAGDAYNTYKTHHFNNGRIIGSFGEVDHKHRVTTWHACYSRNTWPALLATELDLEYVCYAEPGCGNQSITRQFFQYLPYINSNDIVVINWTWIDRWEVFTDHERKSKQWTTLRPSGSKNKKLNEFYFKYLQSETWNKLETLKHILLLTNTLKQKNIRFVITCIDSLILDNSFNSPSYVTNLQSEVKDDIDWFDGLGFFEWSKNNNYQISKTGGHPLEEAHYKAFEYILERM